MASSSPDASPTSVCFIGGTCPRTVDRHAARGFAGALNRVVDFARSTAQVCARMLRGDRDHPLLVVAVVLRRASCRS